MTRTDDELLTLAAKAAGIDAAKPWNALQNDGDAMRLAVKLEMLIETLDHNGKVEVMGGPLGKFNIVQFLPGSDRAATTRRAIVQCAANIGAMT